MPRDPGRDFTFINSLNVPIYKGAKVRHNNTLVRDPILLKVKGNVLENKHMVEIDQSTVKLSYPTSGSKLFDGNTDL